MPRVGGILETALSVADPRRSADFYRRLFGCTTLLETERLVALSVAGRDVLLLFSQGAAKPVTTPGGVIPGHRGGGESHLAFSIEASAVKPWQDRLAAEGIALESLVTWPEGAQSLYFRDPDHHLLELITPGFWALSPDAEPPKNPDVVQ